MPKIPAVMMSPPIPKAWRAARRHHRFAPTAEGQNGAIQRFRMAAGVDGQDVGGRAESFELLPGCHVVATPSVWEHTGDTGVMAVAVNTVTVFFAIPMRAGYVYSVDIDLDSWFNNSARGRAFVLAHEIDPTGAATRSFPSAKSPQDVARCNAAPFQD